jgi:GNAT superfamily N-acetyltransferase
MTKIEVRRPLPDELPTVAAFRWHWVAERYGLPDDGRDAFVRDFVVWVRDNTATHRCLVVVRDGEVLGMAFLAIAPRVPSPRAFTRASGDVQCVYVVPEARGDGLGGRLIDGIVGLAGQLGLERVTVHSSERAVTAYERRGFASSPVLLQISP